MPSGLRDLKSIDTILLDLRGTLVFTPSVTVLIEEMVAQGVPGRLAIDLQEKLRAEMADAFDVLDWTSYAIGWLGRSLADFGHRFDEPRAQFEFEARYLTDSRAAMGVATFAYLLSALSADGKQVVVVADGPALRERKLLAQCYGAVGAAVRLVCSETVGINKLSELFYSRAMRHLSVVPASTLVVGDRLDKDIRPAAAAGCQTFLVGAVWSDRLVVSVERCLEGLLDH